MTSTTTTSSKTAATKTMSARAMSATQLSPFLRTITLRDAVEAFNELDDNFHLVPNHVRGDIRAAMTRLSQTATEAGATHVHDLISHRGAAITAATGVEHPTRILNTSDSTAVHHARNLLLALALSGAASIGATTAPITGAWMTLKARTARTARALFDDEIVLLRTHLAVMTKETKTRGIPHGFADSASVDHLTRAAAYALSEGGMTAGEITSVSLNDISTTNGTTHVSALGNNTVSSRVLELDPFAAGAVTALTAQRAREHGWRPTQPLFYNQNTTHEATKSAAVCAYNRLDRIMATAGLRNTDTTAASLCRWRYQTTFDTQGLDHAAEQSGYTKQLLLKRIVLPAPTNDQKLDHANTLLGVFND